MPLYEFHCDECGKDSELLLRSQDREGEGTRCPHCDSTKLVRKFSIFASCGTATEGSAGETRGGGGCGCGRGGPHRH